MQVQGIQQEADEWQERHDQHLQAAQLAVQHAAEAHAACCSRLASLAQPLVAWLHKQGTSGPLPETTYLSAELASAKKRYDQQDVCCVLTAPSMICICVREPVCCLVGLAACCALLMPSRLAQHVQVSGTRIHT